MKINEKIKLLRALKCLLQPELAENIGEIRSSITSWELGRYKPAAAALDRIATLSGLNYAWLATDELPIFTKF
jgi:transcriptional regulator with XRE-family HTH domain